MKAVCCFAALAAVLVGCCDRPVRDGDALKASSFGWNATNATKCLQAALDSGAERVVVDRQEGDWIIEPVFLRSNQEVVIADGVTVRALKGVFKGRNDCLFTAGGVSNVVLRGEGSATLAMNKKDYQNPDAYSFSEWRHCVAIRGGSDIEVRDLEILSSGGDGVYVRDAANHVRLERLVCRDHHRQGISVISAVDLFVKDCRFDETDGAAPQCGVDLEPNNACDRLEEIVFEDCTFNGNTASGILFHLNQLDDTTRPISVTFRRCVSRGNRAHGIRVGCVGTAGRSVRGSIAFEDCTAVGNKATSLIVANKRSDALDVSFKNCVFDSRDSLSEAVRFDNNALFADFGGLSFENVRIFPGKGVPLAFDGVMGAGIVAGTMKGIVTVVESGEEKPLGLADFAKTHLPNPEAMRSLRDFKTVTPNFRTMKAKCGAKSIPGPVSSTGWLRGKFTFVQYMPAAGDYPIVFRTRPLGKRKGDLKVQVMDALGTDLGSFTVTDAVSTNVIHATGAGVRRFAVTVASGIAAVESAWPGHAVQADAFVHLYEGKNRKFFFSVPVDADFVRVMVKPDEPCSARLKRPDGSIAAEMPYGTGMAVLEAKRENVSTAETWCVEFPRIGEDCRFRIGAPALPLASPSAAAVLF